MTPPAKQHSTRPKTKIKKVKTTTTTTKTATTTTTPQPNNEQVTNTRNDAVAATAAAAAAAATTHASSSSSSSTKSSTKISAAAAAHSSPVVTTSAKITLKSPSTTTGAEWELTWPIWHMLPRDERKAIAIRHGMNTIGEFEEYMSLHKAEEVSSSSMPYPNEAIYSRDDDLCDEKKNEGDYSFDDDNNAKIKSGRRSDGKYLPDDYIDRKMSALDLSSDDDDDDIDDSSSSDDIPNDNDDNNNMAHHPSSSSSSSTEIMTTTELITHGSHLLLLPEDLIHKIFLYLDIHHYHTASLVSPHWSFFTLTERAYKIICTRCYLRQSQRKTLHVANFQNSYLRMLRFRPRVRTGGGLYVLQYRHVKKIQRDMWTEVPAGAVLECVYYRYLYFREDGTVLYACSAAAPQDMIRRFRRVLVTKDTSDEVVDKQAVWGRYEVKKYGVTVGVRHSWCFVRMELKIVPSSGLVESDGVVGGGKFGALSFVRHRSSDSGRFDDDGSASCVSRYHGDVVEYEVPTGYFLFLRDRRL